MDKPTAEIGVFGGSGFYELLDEPARVSRSNTPFGAPSSPVMLGEIGGRSVAFLPRHGKSTAAPAHDQLPRERVGDEGARRDADHRPQRVRFAPDARPARRLRDLRPVRRPDLGPQGHVLRRADHDARVVGGSLLPDDAAGRDRERGELGITAHPTGTVVVIQGPRFSTRAESKWFASQGWEVINMTQYPECYLARELEICYCNISLITDYDAGTEDVAPVTNEEVIRVFNENNQKVKDLLYAMIPALPETRDCPCATRSRAPRSSHRLRSYASARRRR